VRAEAQVLEEQEVLEVAQEQEEWGQALLLAV
jgi:hypothetical protein